MSIRFASLRRFIVLIIALYLMVCAGALHAQLSLSPPASVRASAGDTIVIPLTLVNSSGAPIDAFGLRFLYPADQLVFLQTDKAGTLTANWIQSGGQETTPGNINIGGFNLSSTTSSGVLLKVVFLVKQSATGSGALQLRNFSDDFTNASTIDGVFEVLVAGPCEGALLSATATGAPPGTLIVARNHDTVSVEIRIQQNPQPIGAFGFHLQVNAQQLAFLGFARGALTTGFTDVQVQESIPGSGEFICGGYGTTRIPANSTGALLSLQFQVNCHEGDTSDVVLSDLLDDVAHLNTCSTKFSCEACRSDGDVNGDRQLTPGDAHCAFRIFLNGQTLPADCENPNFDCELVAADVNCNGVITPIDALAILERYLAGLAPQACFAQMQLSKSSLRTEPYHLALRPRVLVRAGDERVEKLMKVSLWVEQATGLRAFGCKLLYPAAKLRFLGVQRTELTSDWAQLDGAMNRPGEITLGGFGAQALAQQTSGELLEVLFVSNGQSVLPEELRLTELVDDFGDARTQVETADAAGSNLVPEIFKLYQSFPNPFSALNSRREVIIRFDLPGHEPVRTELAIYNVNGQLVRRLFSGQRVPGAYEANWDGNDEHGHAAPSGIYWYRLTAGNQAASRQVTVVR